MDAETKNKDLIAKLDLCAANAKKIHEKFQVSKADILVDVPTIDPDFLDCVYDMQSSLSMMAYQLDYVLSAFRDHLKGHLPPIPSTSQMQNALDVLGLDKDYDVVKPIVFATKGGVLVK